MRRIMILAVGAWLAWSGLARGEAAAETPAQREARMKWWSEARFGLFVHWDMSSIAGTEISWSRKATKPLDIFGDKAGYVEDPVYDNLYKQFNPVKFNAREWVRLAKQAGMKYIVFTSKHHGGFCMWDTALTDYSIMHTPFHRDVVKELAQACRKEKLRFGLYYSQRDWHHPDYGVGDNAKYHAYIKGQLTELLSNYGRIDVMWFDSYGRGDSITYWHADEILGLVRRLQPQIIVNNRSGFFGQGVPSLKGDFDTPEEHLGNFQNRRPWESCMCLVTAPGGGWSYRKDGKVKPFADALRMLVCCATGDGNLLLDVGPNAEGVIPEDQAAILREMGAWLKVYGDSIYGTRGGPFRNGAWGGSTYKDKTIFVHVLNWAGDRINLPPLKAKVVACRLMGKAKAQPVVEQTEKGLSLVLPVEQQIKPVTVIQLKLDGLAADELKNGNPL